MKKHINFVVVIINLGRSIIINSLQKNFRETDRKPTKTCPSLSRFFAFIGFLLIPIKHNPYSLLGGCWGKTNQVYKISLKCNQDATLSDYSRPMGYDFLTKMFTVGASASFGGWGRKHFTSPSLKLLQSLQKCLTFQM